MSSTWFTEINSRDKKIIDALLEHRLKKQGTLLITVSDINDGINFRSREADYI